MITSQTVYPKPNLVVQTSFNIVSLLLCLNNTKIWSISQHKWYHLAKAAVPFPRLNRPTRSSMTPLPSLITTSVHEEISDWLQPCPGELFCEKKKRKQFCFSDLTGLRPVFDLVVCNLSRHGGQSRFQRNIQRTCSGWRYEKRPIGGDKPIGWRDCDRSYVCTIEAAAQI